MRSRKKFRNVDSGMSVKRNGQWIIVGVSNYEASFIPKTQKSEVIYHDIAVSGALFNSEECKIMLNRRYL
jgi:hypothetical protein